MYTLAIIGFVIGAVVGSFLNVVVWRLPRGMSLVTPPSTCPKCGHRIRPWENIPIVSWFFLGGKCSSCHLPISWKYPAGETAAGILYALIAVRVYREGLPLSTMFPWFWFAGAILAVARTDFESHVIPNVVTYSGMAAALAFSLLLPYTRPALAAPGNPDFGTLLTEKLVTAIRGMAMPHAAADRIAALADCVLGLLLGWLLLEIVYQAGVKVLAAIRRRKGDKGDAIPSEPLGRGDIKMLAMTGAFLGCDAVVFLLAGGTLLGFLGAIVSLGIPRRQKQASTPAACAQVPFAPYFAVPALIWVVGGNWFYILYKSFASGY